MFVTGGDAGSDKEASLTKTLGFTFGGPTSIGTNLTATDSGAIHLELTSSTLITAKDTAGHTVFTLAIIGVPGSEQLQLTQLEAIDHDAAPGSDETPDLFDEVVGLFTAQGSAVGLQLEVTRTDKDGDHITQSAVVPLIGPAGEGAPTPFFSFDDDGPDVTLAGATVAEENGPTVNGTWTLDPGSDGVDQVQVTVGNDTHTLSLLVGQQTVFNLTEGVLTVKSDLTWTFDPNGNINVNTPVSFSIAATDGDGDTDTATHTIR